MGTGYSIAQASAASGLSVDTLRYYERIGLVDPPARDAAGRRRYDDADLGWLEFLMRMRTTGMPLSQIGEYARLRGRGEAGAGERRAILERHRAALCAHISELQACLAVIDRKITTYEDVERDIERKVSA